MPRSKLLIADSHTVGLWRLGKTEIKDAEQTGAPKASLNFDTDDWRTPPDGWTRYGVISFAPTWNNGIMTVYCFSDPDATSYIHSNSADNRGIFADGFRIKFNFRTAPGTDSSPNEGTQPLFYNRDGTASFSIYYHEDDYFYFGNVSSQKIIDSNVYWDKYSWTDIEVLGYQIIPADNTSCYLELYINGHLVRTAYAQPDGSIGAYIGCMFDSNGGFTSSDYSYYAVYEGKPFSTLNGTNLALDVSADLPMKKGLDPAKVEDTSVPFEYALDFDGSIAMYTSNAIFDLTGPFTIEGWINADIGSLGSIERVIAGKQALNSSGWALLVNSSGNLVGRLYDGSVNELDSGVTVGEDTWYHVALTWSGTNLAIYVNGVLKANQSLGYVSNTANDFVIGAYSDGTSNIWNGQMSDFRLSDIARNAGEIHNVYYALSGVDTGFDEDINTLAVYNFGEDPGKLVSLSGSRQQESHNLINFTSQDVFDEFFRQPDIALDGGPVVSIVSDKLRLTYVGYPGLEDWYGNVYSSNRSRLSGDFDISTKIYLSGWTDRYTPYSMSSANIIGLYLQSVDNIWSTNLLYEHWNSGGTNYNRIRFYSNETVGSTQWTSGLHVAFENITFRMVREGNVWYGYYKIDNATSWTYLGKATGSEKDCVIRLYSKIDNEQTKSGTFYHEWGPISVEGRGVEPGADGYLITDFHGADAYGIGIPAFYASPITNAGRAFDGFTTYMQIRDHQEWDHTSFSAEIWFNAFEVKDAKLISRLGDTSGSEPGWYIGIGSDGSITVYIKSSGVGPEQELSISAGSYSIKEWNYVALTFDYSTKELRLYLNGELLGANTMDPLSSGNFSSTLPIDIARNSWLQAENFYGSISAVRISDNARGQKEIFDYYHGSNVKGGP